MPPFIKHTTLEDKAAGKKTTLSFINTAFISEAHYELEAKILTVRVAASVSPHSPSTLVKIQGDEADAAMQVIRDLT